MALPEVTESVDHATLPSKTPGGNTGALPEEVTLLKKEMSKTMGCLLMTRTSLDVCQQKQGSDFEMVLCCNEAEAIREANAHCGASIREVEACHATLVRGTEAHYATLLREAEDDCTTIVGEVEAHCTAYIRKAESHCMEKANSIQQLLAENMQHLEMDTIEDKGRDHLSFLATCGVALQVCPPKDPWRPNGPPSTTHREHTAGHSSKHSHEVCSSRERPTPVVSPAATPAASRPSSGTK